jgi:hypothetical protein
MIRTSNRGEQSSDGRTLRFMRLYGPKGLLPTLVNSLGLSNSNAFALALSNQISLELSEGSQQAGKVDLPMARKSLS